MPQPQPSDPEHLASARQGRDAADVTVQLYEETAQVGRREVLQGRIEIRTATELREETVREALSHTDVAVTRVPVGRTLMEGEPLPQVRTDGDLTIVPVFEEILIIEKRLVLKEEIHLQRTTRSETVEVPITLRSQQAEVKRVEVQSGGGVHDEKPQS